MAEPKNTDENGSGRATVALVDAKVDGLKELIRAEFANVREDVKPLAGLSLDVAMLKVEKGANDRRFVEHERRFDRLEARRKSDQEYRRAHLPSLVISGVVGIASIVAIVLTQVQ